MQFYCFCFYLSLLRDIVTKSFSSEGMQQNTVKVTGTVKDTNGEPIIGANVMVVGTATGVITDIDGNFMLEVPVGVNYNLVLLGIRNR